MVAVYDSSNTISCRTSLSMIFILTSESANICWRTEETDVNHNKCAYIYMYNVSLEVVHGYTIWWL